MLIHQIGYGHPTPAYSSEPGHAWSIIHREKISILWWESTQRWGARIGFRYEMFGSCGLQAAMRAFVEARLGREVEIPDELIPPKLRNPVTTLP